MTTKIHGARKQALDDQLLIWMIQNGQFQESQIPTREASPPKASPIRRATALLLRLIAMRLDT